MKDDVLIRVENVSKRFCRSLKRSFWYGVEDATADLLGRLSGPAILRPDEYWAVDKISFKLKRGECLGLVGRNGAGKTTLLKMLTGLIKPDNGRIELRGRVCALISLGAGFNPILTGRENIYVNGAILRLSKREIDEKIDEIIEFAEIGDFIDAPVQSYSSGMAVRLGFAIATAVEPDVLLLDEVLAVGDANFQAKCYQKVGKLLTRAAVILVSHSAHHIKKMCDRSLLIDRGVLIEDGKSEKILELYQQRNNVMTLETFKVLADNVKSAVVENLSNSISTGNFLEFNFAINLNDETEISQCYLNLVDSSDIVHAQVVLSGFERRLPVGLSQFVTKIGPLYLSSGQYSGNLMMFGEGGKTSIAHLRHCLNFNFVGPINLGPVYYPPSEVYELQ